MIIYKVSFGFDGCRGIEYASIVNASVIKGLWGHKCKVELTRTDTDGYKTYQLTTDMVTGASFPVLCQLIEMHSPKRLEGLSESPSPSRKARTEAHERKAL